LVTNKGWQTDNRRLGWFEEYMKIMLDSFNFPPYYLQGQAGTWMLCIDASNFGMLSLSLCQQCKMRDALRFFRDRITVSTAFHIDIYCREELM
jgi:hypothetical protein